MYIIWNFFVPFRNGHFHNVASLLTNVVKLDVEKGNVVSTLSNVAHINVEMYNVDETLFDVVNPKVRIRNVVSMWIGGFTRHDVISTKRQRRNNVEMFAGIRPETQNIDKHR